MWAFICIATNTVLCGGGACLFNYWIGEYTAFVYVGFYVGLVVAEMKGL